MKIDVGASQGWYLGQAPYPFQQTCATPLENLPLFVKTLLAPFAVAQASFWIELIVLEPRELIWFLRGLDIASDQVELNRSVILAENRLEAHDLLECVLGQWTDFALLPAPKEFAIYADHDEYTTIFTRTAAVLTDLSPQMKKEGFREIEGWTWTQSRSQPAPGDGAASA